MVGTVVVVFPAVKGSKILGQPSLAQMAGLWGEAVLLVGGVGL